MRNLALLLICVLALAVEARAGSLEAPYAKFKRSKPLSQDDWRGQFQATGKVGSVPGPLEQRPTAALSRSQVTLGAPVPRGELVGPVPASASTYSPTAADFAALQRGSSQAGGTTERIQGTTSTNGVNSSFRDFTGNVSVEATQRGSATYFYDSATGQSGYARTDGARTSFYGTAGGPSGSAEVVGNRTIYRDSLGREIGSSERQGARTRLYDATGREIDNALER